MKNSLIVQDKTTSPAKQWLSPHRYVRPASSVNEALRTPSQQIDARTRALMESRFAYDFSQVKIHSGESAAQSALAFGAKAFTVGQDIIFGAQNYNPQTTQGKRLLAHELVHVIQQDGAVEKIQREPAVGHDNDRYEQEARQIAHEVVPEAQETEETTAEQTIAGSFPIEQQFAFYQGESENSEETHSRPLSAMITRLQSRPPIQQLCTKTRAEAGYAVRVNLDVPPTPAPDHSHDTAWISARANDPSGQTPGLTDLSANFRYAITIRSDRTSSWVHRMSIWFQRPRIRIYITNAMGRGSCEYNDLLRHEQRHDTDYRENISETETRICNSSVGWPNVTNRLSTSVLSGSDLRTQLNDWLNLEHWQMQYENWLDGCAWDSVDYPRLYTGCPGTRWRAPQPSCQPQPVRPAVTVFPLPRR